MTAFQDCLPQQDVRSVFRSYTLFKKSNSTFLHHDWEIQRDDCGSTAVAPDRTRFADIRKQDASRTSFRRYQHHNHGYDVGLNAAAHQWRQHHAAVVHTAEHHCRALKTTSTTMTTSTPATGQMTDQITSQLMHSQAIQLHEDQVRAIGRVSPTSTWEAWSHGWEILSSGRPQVEGADGADRARAPIQCRQRTTLAVSATWVRALRTTWSCQCHLLLPIHKRSQQHKRYLYTLIHLHLTTLLLQVLLMSP